jgi:RNA polymerase sigma factor (sigma-70 family)
MSVESLVEHSFRHQYGRLVALLTRSLGVQHVDLAEDVVQSALAKALISWRQRGLPDDPSAWLYRVARNLAVDALRRQALAKSEPAAEELISQLPGTDVPSEVHLESEIADSQLRLIFTCCHPELPDESRLALTLKTLCGFSVDEIAHGLLTNAANVQKRITRAKEKIREDAGLLWAPAGSDLPPRLDSVHRVLYLIFNEGYNSSHPEELIRRDLCDEAIRLGELLASQPQCCTPTTLALLALMVLHRARFDARLDNEGCILLMEEQDRTAWDRRMIGRGLNLMAQSAEGHELSLYHILLGIAWQHCVADSFDATDWPAILKHYDLLRERFPSPVVELNRAIVVAQIHGPQVGLAEISTIRGLDLLGNYHLLEATLGELHLRAGDKDAARRFFRAAAQKTHSIAERRLLDRKMAE